MIRKIKSLAGGDESSIKSGRDAMSEEQKKELDSLKVENASLKEELKQGHIQYIELPAPKGARIPNPRSNDRFFKGTTHSSCGELQGYNVTAPLSTPFHPRSEERSFSATNGKVMDTAIKIESERNGLIVAMKVFTETVVTTVKSLTA